MAMHRRIVLIVASVLALWQTAAFAELSRPPARQLEERAWRSRGDVAAVPGRLIVGMRPGGELAAKSQNGNALALAGRWGVSTPAKRLAGGLYYQIDAPSGTDLAALRARIAADSDVAFVEPDYVYHASVIPNDEFYSRLYALPRVAADSAWDRTTGSPDVLVAVIDTGIYAGHPDLAGNVVAGTDFVNDDGDASDDEGHGTHTAGIIAAVGNNGRGVAGMCWQCQLLPVKSLDNEGSGSATTVAAGIRYAADRGARVINLSLGGDRNSRLLHDAVKYATNRGALVIVAAGNEAQEGNPVEYPAAYPEVLAVAATDQDDRHAPFSNYHSYVDVAAPGVNIGSTIWADGEAEAYAAATST
jgi:thermitase